MENWYLLKVFFFDTVYIMYVCMYICKEPLSGVSREHPQHARTKEALPRVRIKAWGRRRPPLVRSCAYDANNTWKRLFGANPREMFSANTRKVVLCEHRTVVLCEHMI